MRETSIFSIISCFIFLKKMYIAIHSKVSIKKNIKSDFYMILLFCFIYFNTKFIERRSYIPDCRYYVLVEH